MNHFDTPRLDCIKINADANLKDIMPARKSMVFEVVMNSEDENVSPMIDLERMAVLTTNRLSGDFGDFDDDGFMKRTKVTGQDPNTATYISNLLN